MQTSRAFPLLNYFSIHHASFQWSNLVLLDLRFVDIYSAARYLLETKTKMSRLTQLKVYIPLLKRVIMDFTRDAICYNRSEVKELIDGTDQ